MQWLVLIHRLPPEPPYRRVKVRRKLQHIGAVALKNTVYVLPDRPDCHEDLQWLQREIVAEGGEATLWCATLEGGLTDAEIVAAFRDGSDSEYAALIDAMDRGFEGSEADAERFRRQLAAIEGRDYFAAAGRSAAVARLHRLETPPAKQADSRAGPVPLVERGTTWVTRRDVFVDRIASAWLIRRFIDSDASFKFVSPRGYRARDGELLFDMFDVGFTHEGGACTFETLLAHFRLEGDPALVAMGEIVHEIDVKDGKFGRHESRWVADLVRGLRLAHAGDAARVDAGAALFDALYASLGRVGEC